MASKIGIKNVGRNANITLVVPAGKLADVLIAIGKALGGRPTDSIVHKSNARSRRNQRRKSLQRDNHTVLKKVCEPAVITPKETIGRVAVNPTTNVVKQPSAPTVSPVKAVDGGSEKNHNQPNKAVHPVVAKPIKHKDVGTELSAVADCNQRASQMRIKTPSLGSQKKMAVDKILTTLASIRSDNFGTIVGEGFELFSLPPHLPGIPVTEIQRLLSLKLHVHQGRQGPTHVPKWMWEQEPQRARMFQESINIHQLAEKFRAVLKLALNKREEFKTSTGDKRKE